MRLQFALVLALVFNTVLVGQQITVVPQKVSVVIPAETATQITKVLDNPDSGRSVALTVRGLRVPKDWTPTTAIGVYLCDPDAKPDSLPEAKYLVASFHLLEGGQEVQNVIFDLNKQIANLRKSANWNPSKNLGVFLLLQPSGAKQIRSGEVIRFESVSVRVIER